jgi:large exoprotein involved in heme utilization and adhesion
MSQILRTRQGYINGCHCTRANASQPPLTEPENSLVGGLRINKTEIVIIF